MHSSGFDSEDPKVRESAATRGSETEATKGSASAGKTAPEMAVLKELESEALTAQGLAMAMAGGF